MRIHTSVSKQEIYKATADLPGVYAEITEHGSKTHARAFEVYLEGNGRYGGQWGDRDAKSATWDEWGVVMARVFALDPNTRMGGSAKRPIYADAEDFRWQTNGRFGGWEAGWNAEAAEWGEERFIAIPTLPEDTHPVHRWEFAGTVATNSYSVAECKKCSALKRWRWLNTARQEMSA